MGSNILNALYEKAPPLLQTLALNMYALKVHKERYGNNFIKIYNELSSSQYLSTSQIEEYQNRQLITIIKHAYNTTRYYKELFDQHGIKPSDIRSKIDLNKIPVLTKEIIKANFEKLISNCYSTKELVHGHTSGTTGTPLDVLWDKNTCEYTNAVDWRQKNWAGIKFGDKISVILGRTIIPIKNTKPPFWKINYLHNQLWLSAFHLSDDNLKFYFQKLKRYNPVAIEGYPSTIYLLARYLNDRGKTFRLKSVLTSSETLYTLQREAIEKAFECKIFDYYGMAERVLFATECEAHTSLHLNFEYGLTEIVDENGMSVNAGQSGFVVSTSLQNMGMPLIRYKTSDVSAIKKEKCICGRDMPLIEKITTKTEDIIIRPDGRLISPSVLTHPFKTMRNISKSQIIQDDTNHITIKIVKKSEYNTKDEQALLEAFQQRVGNDMILEFKYVNEIKCDKSGKFRWVISNVSKNIYNFNEIE